MDSVIHLLKKNYVTGLLTAVWKVTLISTGLWELAREKGSRVRIAHMRYLKVSDNLIAGGGVLRLVTLDPV